MIDILIPIGSAYTPDNENNILPDYGELKYCLRGIEKHLSNVGKVYLLFGNNPLPTWLNTEAVNVDRKMDLFKNEFKERNIYNKILFQLQKSERILFMNDDHFMLSGFDAHQFPNFCYTKTVYQVTEAIRGATPYKYTLGNTIELLGNDARYFDIHCPIIYERDKFLKAFQNLIMSKAYGYCLKSVYGNKNELPAVEADDVKIYAVSTYETIKAKIEGKSFFSTNDNVFGAGMIQVLNELYPNKSKYELWED